MSITGSDVLDLHRISKPYSGSFLHQQPASTFSTNIGLARLLDERNIFAGSTLSLVNEPMFCSFILTSLEKIILSKLNPKFNAIF